MSDDKPKEPTLRGMDIAPPSFAFDAQLDRLTRHIFPHYPHKEQIDNFFQVLGRAITIWQLVETALYEVYERAIGPLRPGACGASFHSMQTFEAKLRATDDALSFALIDRPETFDEWRDLKKRASEKSKRRNQFVHFSTYIMYNEPSDNDKIRLEPQMYDWRFINERPKLRVSEISDIAETFVEIANSLRAFKEKVPPAA